VAEIINYGTTTTTAAAAEVAGRWTRARTDHGKAWPRPLGGARHHRRRRPLHRLPTAVVELARTHRGWPLHPTTITGCGVISFLPTFTLCSLPYNIEPPLYNCDHRKTENAEFHCPMFFLIDYTRAHNNNIRYVIVYSI